MFGTEMFKNIDITYTYETLRDYEYGVPKITWEESKVKVITLCGSTKFKEAFATENARLTLEGFIVMSVGVFGHSDLVVFTTEQKEMLDEIHKRKIDMSDAIHVINVDKCIGKSTTSEIKYARSQNKRVSYAEPGGLQ
jgi:hypothetical protein